LIRSTALAVNQVWFGLEPYGVKEGPALKIEGRGRKKARVGLSALYCLDLFAGSMRRERAQRLSQRRLGGPKGSIYSWIPMQGIPSRALTLLSWVCLPVRAFASIIHLRILLQLYSHPQSFHSSLSTHLPLPFPRGALSNHAIVCNISLNCAVRSGVPHM
jgi:hypothetical protein